MQQHSPMVMASDPQLNLACNRLNQTFPPEGDKLSIQRVVDKEGQVRNAARSYDCAASKAS